MKIMNAYRQLYSEKDLAQDLVLSPIEVIFKVMFRFAVNAVIMIFHTLINIAVKTMNLIIRLSKLFRNFLLSLITANGNGESDRKHGAHMSENSEIPYQVSLDYICMK